MTRQDLKQSGFTLVEAMVSVAMLGILATATMTIVATMSSQVSSNVSDDSEQKVVSSLIDQIRADPNRFQKNYAPVTTPDDTLLTAAGAYPLAWSNRYFGNVAFCPRCYGRMAFLIRPAATAGGTVIPSLYEVHIYTIDLRRRLTSLVNAKGGLSGGVLQAAVDAANAATGNVGWGDGEAMAAAANTAAASSLPSLPIAQVIAQSTRYKFLVTVK